MGNVARRHVAFDRHGSRRFGFHTSERIVAVEPLATGEWSEMGRIFVPAYAPCRFVVADVFRRRA